MFCSNSTLLRASAPETRTLQSPHVCFQYGSMDGDLTGSAPRAPHFYPQHFNRTGQNKLNHWICLLHLYKEQTVLCLRAKRKPFGDVQDKTNTWRLVVRTGSCCHTAGKGSTRKPVWSPSEQPSHSVQESARSSAWLSASCKTGMEPLWLQYQTISHTLQNIHKK